MFDFLKHWVAREAALQQQPGFLGLQVRAAAGRNTDQHRCRRVRSLSGSTDTDVIEACMCSSQKGGCLMTRALLPIMTESGCHRPCAGHE